VISLKRTRQAAAKILRMLEERSDPVPAWKLALAAGLEGDRTHRDTRRAVAYLTDAGFPVVHAHGQGYRLARSAEDVDRYVDKMVETIDALRSRVERAQTYRKLYTRHGYMGRLHGPCGATLEMLTEAV
jgi:hypothetical protein